MLYFISCLNLSAVSIRKNGIHTKHFFFSLFSYTDRCGRLALCLASCPSCWRRTIKMRFEASRCPLSALGGSPQANGTQPSERWHIPPSAGKTLTVLLYEYWLGSPALYKKATFFVISFSYLLKWKLSYNSDRFSSMFGSGPPPYHFLSHLSCFFSTTGSVLVSVW